MYNVTRRLEKQSQTFGAAFDKPHEAYNANQ